MKFGIHSLLFSETFGERDLPLLDRAREMGFDALEVIPFDADAFPAAKVRQRADELGLDIYLGIGLPGHANPISPEAGIRRDALAYSRRLVDLCAESGAKGYGGVTYCGWGYLTGTMRSADEWAWALEHFRALAEHAAEVTPGMNLAVEPVNRFESHFINTAADAVAFCREVGMPNVRVHLDSFHMIREEDDFVGAVHTCGPLLGYVHACENQRGVPGRGQVPWLEFFRALKAIDYQGCVTIESFDPNMAEIARLCCIWRKLAESPEQLATEGLQYLRGVAEAAGAGSR